MARALSRALGVAAVLVLLACRATPALAEDLDDYRHLLQAALDDVNRGDSAGAARIAAQLRSADTVRMPDGSVVHPDNRAIIRALATRPPDLNAARLDLLARLAAIENSGSAQSVVARSDARNRLQQVLARPEFQPKPPPDPVSSFIQSVERYLEQQLISRLEAIFGSSESSDPGTFLAAGLGILVLAGLIVVIVRGIRQTIGSNVARADLDQPMAVATADAVRAEAACLAQAGSFRAAIRALYLATLLNWDEQGRLRFDRSLTNREVLARAKTQADTTLFERLAPLVERFDRYWYGGALCTVDEYRAFADLAARAWDLR